MSTADFIAEIEAMHGAAVEQHDACRRVDLFTEAVIWSAKADTLAIVLEAARRLLATPDAYEYALTRTRSERAYDRRMARAEHDS